MGTVAALVTVADSSVDLQVGLAGLWPPKGWSGMHSPFQSGLAISAVNTLREAPLRALPFL
ncbi:hypothetical protein [Streptomyces sp. NPDC046197]|uniref:hypothetical protein n=1 Tax=Streptomyces sp. NPDC046197 TaxID=3154337 RepID=UPI003410FCC0